WITSLEEALRGAPNSQAAHALATPFIWGALPNLATLRRNWENVKGTTKNAFNETDPAKRDEGIKKAGDQLLAVMYQAKLAELAVNMAVIAAWADDAGVPPARLVLAA